MDIPYITATDVVLDWTGMVAALRAGHHGVRPAISDQLLHRGDDVLLSRAAWAEGLGVAVKSETVFPAQVPSVQGAMLLFDDQTGALNAVIDSALVTRWKTVADSLLGAQILARPEAKRLLIIGAGTVAEGLIEAYSVLFPDLEIEIWNRNMARAEALTAGKPHVRAVADLPEAVARADIISTATMAKRRCSRGRGCARGSIWT